MAEIGDLFKSNQIVPVSGEYKYVRHVNPTYCPVSEEQRRISLKKGEKFPSHKDCLRWVYWELVKKADESE